MKPERELERHNRVIEQIKNANSMEDLPKITPSTISSFFASNVYFDDFHISPSEFKVVTEELLKGKRFESKEVTNIFMNILRSNYPYQDEMEYYERYSFIVDSPRIDYLLQEIELRNEKIKEIELVELQKEHDENMLMIGMATSIKHLPKTSRASITNLLSDITKTEHVRISQTKFNDIVDEYLENGLSEEFHNNLLFLIEDELGIITKKEFDKLIEEIILNKKMQFYVSEVKAKEAKIKVIYKMEHDDVMNQIEDANCIRQLPSNLSISKITSYLSGNSIIYSKAEPISSTEFVKLVYFLLNGKELYKTECIDELRRISETRYPNNEEAFNLLYEKISELPKLGYYIKEVKEYQKRKSEFIACGASRVNIYNLPNPKSLEQGSNCYNLYVSSLSNLDLTGISKNVDGVDCLEYSFNENDKQLINSSEEKEKLESDSKNLDTYSQIFTENIDLYNQFGDDISSLNNADEERGESSVRGK